MVRSMTAFGRAKREGADKDITVEIRSVNSRFFDCNVKMPRSYAFLEEKIKAHLQKSGVSRGKLEVYLSINEIDKVTIDQVVSVIDEFYNVDKIATATVGPTRGALKF